MPEGLISPRRTTATHRQERTIVERNQPPVAAEAVFPETLFTPAGDERALVPAAELSEQAKEAIGRAIAASRSPNTRRSYQVAWRAWEAWARGRGYPPMPAGAETVAAYLTERAAAGAGASTLGMALAAIAAAHGAAGETDPTRSEGVRRTAAGLRRESSGRAQRQARPLTEMALAAITASTPPTARGRTELALCRTMRDALLRRSEAAALTWADLEHADDGSGRLTIRRAKGDQEGRGAVVYIGTEALAALEAIRPGTAGPGAPVFASPREPGKALSESAIAPRGGPGSAPASRGTRPGSAWSSTSAAPGWPLRRSSRPAAGPARRWSCATPAQRAPAAARSRPSMGRSGERACSLLEGVGLQGGSCPAKLV